VKLHKEWEKSLDRCAGSFLCSNPVHGFSDRGQSRGMGGDVVLIWVAIQGALH